MNERHKYKPTVCHYFQKLLYDKNKLHRIYTQNVDNMEEEAGIPVNKVIHAHGSLNSATCNICGHTYPFDWILGKALKLFQLDWSTQALSICLLYNQDQLVRSEEIVCDHCEQFIKPNIVLFGENLPYEYIKSKDKDLSKCDLVIVFGTSLKTEPLASLFKQVSPSCMRLLINGDLVGPWADRRNGRFHAHIVDDCDSACLRLLELLGWTNELRNTRQSISVFPSNLTNLQRSVSSVQYHQQQSFPGDSGTISTLYSNLGHAASPFQKQPVSISGGGASVKPLNYSKSFNYDMRGNAGNAFSNHHQNLNITGRLKSIRIKSNACIDVQLHADPSQYSIWLNQFRFVDHNNMIVFPSNVSNNSSSNGAAMSTKAEESYLIDYLSKIVNREVELKILADRSSGSRTHAKFQILSMKLSEPRNASYPSAGASAIKFY